MSETAEKVHLEVQEGTSETGEAMWKDAGPIHLLDSVQSVQESAPRAGADADAAAAPNTDKQALPKQAKEWLLSNHSVKTKKDRKNLYLFRNAPDNGNNTNLLILLHGSGDSHRPFDKLAQTMSLPQTATLSIHSRVCGVDLPFDLGSTWFHELDYATGNALALTDIRRTISLTNALVFLTELLQRLSSVWVPGRIFLFGYGAGASVIIETCRSRIDEPLGGAICVGMGWGRIANVSTSNDRTPLLLLSDDEILLEYYKNGCQKGRGKNLVTTFVQANKGMISGPHEMEAVMKFLSKRLVLSSQLPTRP